MKLIQLPLFDTCNTLGCGKPAAGRIATLPFCEQHLAVIKAQGRKEASASAKRNP